jgi:putative membrane protein
MARTLVISVDRDNDLGIKAGIRGPVIGRKKVLTAALRLGIADPEESDTNAILGALNQHDNLADSTEGNDEVEIVILTGDEKVGVKSDRIISAQLEEVVHEFQPDLAIVVTDGAEDESVLPIIQSQVRVEHVKKIIVKQSKGIEGTYYYIVKILEDPKWRAKMLTPISAFLMIIGLGIILWGNGGELLMGGLPLFAGLYLLAKGLGFDDKVARVINDMRDNVDAALFSSIMWLGGIFALVFAVAQSWAEYSDLKGAKDVPGTALLLTQVTHESLLWIIISFLLFTGGVLLLRLKRGSFSGRAVIVAAFGMVVYSFLDAALTILEETITGTYTWSVNQILQDISKPLFWAVILWVVLTVVRSLRERKTSGSKYWGI